MVYYGAQYCHEEQSITKEGHITTFVHTSPNQSVVRMVGEYTNDMLTNHIALNRSNMEELTAIGKGVFNDALKRHDESTTRIVRANAALAIMGEDPAASWLTYLIVGISFILGASAALIVRTMRSEDEKTLTEDLLGYDVSTVDSSQPAESPILPLPDLAVPLPPPPGGDQDP